MRWDQIESKWHAMTRRVRSGEALNVENLRDDGAGALAAKSGAALSRGSLPSEDRAGTQQ